MDFLKGLLNSGWVSTTVGIVGVVVALLLYRASLVGGRMVYQRRGVRLIGPDERGLPDGIEIRYKGEVVDRLTKTHLVFWNSGKVLLRGSDIVAEDPLRCDFSPEARVLEVRRLSASRPANKFVATLDAAVPNRVLIAFDYLDPEDGAVFEILHTDMMRYPTVEGTIKGVPRGVLDWGRIVSNRPRDVSLNLRTNRFVPIALVTVGLSVASIGFVPELARYLPFRSPTENATHNWPLGLAGILYALMPILVAWRTRRRFPKVLCRQELEE